VKSPAVGEPGFAVYDATIGQGQIATGMLPNYWTSMAPFSDGQGNYSPTRPRVEAVAKLIGTGGPTVDGRNVSPGTFSTLDFELSQNRSPKYMLKRLRWFRKANRSALITLYGYPLLGYGAYREQIINPSPEVTAALAKAAVERAPIARKVNVVTVEAYMLGPQYLERDLQYLEAGARLMRQAFPNRPVYAWAWGAYHTNWNPAGSVLSETDSWRYVDVLKRNFDGVIVWGPKSDNTMFTQMLMGQRERPLGQG